MVLRFIPSPIPIFSPPPPPAILHHNSHCPTEIRFSRWNNANAAPFIHHQRQQQQIERDIRLNRRHESADRITSSPRSSNPPLEKDVNYRSYGTPSSPSSPSIPGKKSKYSKKPKRDPQSPRVPQISDFSHPAFRSVDRWLPGDLPNEGEKEKSSSSMVKLGENGLSYVIENAPFEYRYSYTETPKAKPLGHREPPFLPFGPATMQRPWTGRAPLPKSKKSLPEFDSFKPPPAGKKGVKPVQNPGPFLAGSGPKYGSKSREEVLGEPLTEVEAKDMVRACMKTTRQLNIGRDGLTHNMLDNIHAHWKRRRVCKIKCKGVCTVDMQNVIEQLEDKTGGKVIHNKGGVIFLFRGRNYNYMTRPRYPLMLWKPSPPIYPKLIQKVPEGLTLEEATELRKKGRELPPISKLGKNGVYINLVKSVMEAFEECELVRINCQGLNKSDVRKIGAKLQHLVPCVLISFEFEHILMWRGKDWTSSLPQSKDERSVADPSLNNQSIVERTNPVPCSINNTFLEPNLTGFQMGSEDIQVCGDSDAAESMMTTNDKSEEASSAEENIHNRNDSPPQRRHTPYVDGVMLLLKQAIDNGSAVILDNNSLDANIVYDKAVDLAKTAPPGPIFKLQAKKKTKHKVARVQSDKIHLADDEVEVVAVVKKASNEKKNGKQKKNYKGSLTQEFTSVAPHGSLKIDELAKLLA